MNAAGVVAVARQEFTVRIRKGRWRYLLAAWFVVLLAFTALLRAALTRAGSDVQPYRGAVMYGGLMLLVLSIALLVAPALTAQSVNGDRERGTLATLQVTRLRPAEITLGKFVAAWGTVLVFLALTAPLVVWCVFEGGMSASSIVVVSAVLAVLLGTGCALSLGFSALLSRSTTSGVLSYLAVFALSVGTVVTFGLSSLLTQETYTESCAYDAPPPAATAVPVPGGPEEEPAVPGPPSDCVYTATRVRTDRTWVLLAPNPFVVLADAAPYRPRCQTLTGGLPPQERQFCDSGLDPLGGIGRSVRDLRRPVGSVTLLSSEPDERRGDPVWPTGLAMHLTLGVVMLLVTTRRLRTPSRELPRGQRVA